MNNKKILVIDVELTCWDYKSEEPNEIIEIGLIEVDSISLDIIRKQQFFIKPMKSSISTYCTNLTGISNKTLKSALNYQDVVKILMNKYGSKNKMYVGWGFDNIAFEKQTILYPNIENPFSINYLNLSQLYSMKKKTYKKFSLIDALENENMQFIGNQHSGIDDAYNTALLLKKIL